MFSAVWMALGSKAKYWGQWEECRDGVLFPGSFSILSNYNHSNKISDYVFGGKTLSLFIAGCHTGCKNL